MRTIFSALVLGMFQAADIQAQGTDTLALRIPPMEPVVDSAKAARPASHRTVEKSADQPVRVLYCPTPGYPTELAGLGFAGQVNLEFVVDTLGLAEMDDLFVAEASHIGFVQPARRAIAKCRYRPAQKAQRPVRQVVQQRIVWRQQSPDSIP